MNEENQFNFNKYNTEQLKEQSNPEILEANVQTENPALGKQKPSEDNFLEIEDNDIFGPMEQQPISSHQQPLSIPYDNSSSGYGNSYLALVLSPNLKELELMIRGLEYVKQFNSQKGKEEFVLRKIPNHPLNEYGINQIITQLKIYTSPEIKLGRKKIRDYYNSIQHISKTIVRLIYKNLNSFGMDTQEKQRNAKVFCDAIIEVIDASYSRSIEGKENDLSRATEFKIEGNIDALQNPSKFFGGDKKRDLKN